MTYADDHSQSVGLVSVLRNEYMNIKYGYRVMKRRREKEGRLESPSKPNRLICAYL